MGNKEPESQKTFVEDILTLQKKLDNVLKSAFFNQVISVHVYFSCHDSFMCEFAGLDSRPPA